LGAFLIISIDISNLECYNLFVFFYIKEFPMKKSVKNLLIVIICVVCVLIAAVGSTGIAVAATHKNQKKAVIILPGLFASGLYDTETGKAAWDPFDGIDAWFTDFTGRGGLPIPLLIQLLGEEQFMTVLNNLLANDGKGTPDSMFNMMAMTEDGEPVVKTIKPVPFDSESRLKYGVVNTHTDIYNTLEEQYGDAYEVQVFNYDFRLDNRDSAQKLEEYINQKGYKEVILVSHSNGGSVAACYFARSQANRDKTKLYLSFDAPYYGAFAAIGTLENVDRMISGAVDQLKENSLTKKLATSIEDIFDNQFTRLLGIWAVYQLLPSYDLLTTQQYYHVYDEQIKGFSGKSGEPTQIIKQEAMINIDGEDVFFKNAEELWDFYCSRPWAKKENGELRKQMKEWLDFHDAMKVTLDDGTKVHSTSLVNTQYLSGMGYNNTTKIYYKTDENIEGGLVQLDKYDFSNQGDGTVQLYSATAGTTDISRINIIPHADHYDVFQRFNLYSKDITLKLINDELDTWDKLLINLYK
jgi:pimeloyl-ACP methyl ester carboxylesterase